MVAAADCRKILKMKRPAVVVVVAVVAEIGVGAGGCCCLSQEDLLVADPGTKHLIV